MTLASAEMLIVKKYGAGDFGRVNVKRSACTLISLLIICLQRRGKQISKQNAKLYEQRSKG